MRYRCNNRQGPLQAEVLLPCSSCSCTLKLLLQVASFVCLRGLRKLVKKITANPMPVTGRVVRSPRHKTGVLENEFRSEITVCLVSETFSVTHVIRTKHTVICGNELYQE